MKKTSFLAVLLFSFIALSAQNLPTKSDVLKKMEQANNYFMRKWPDPSANIVTNKTRPSNLWTRAVYYEGLMQLYYTSKDPALLKYAEDWGVAHSWLPTYVKNKLTRNADNICCGQTYLELYQLDPSNKERILPIQKSVDAMINSTKVDDWWWIDAIQMAMPVFAKFGLIYNDNRYYEKMYDMYEYTRDKAAGIGLYNQKDSLWYRDSTFLPPKVTANNLPIYWSRGNGWVLASYVRVLDILPNDFPHRDAYLRDFKEMSAKLIKIQRADGFWNCDLGDPNHFGGKESSGTALFVYGMAWGINHGVLDKETYLAPVVKAWNVLVKDALHCNGFLGYMQSSGDKPEDGQPLSYDKIPDFEDYGLGCFLLAGSEMYKLANANQK